MKSYAILFAMILLGGCAYLEGGPECTSHVALNQQGETYYWYEGDCNAVSQQSASTAVPFVLQFDNLNTKEKP
jgi:hypothetical protein